MTITQRVSVAFFADKRRPAAPTSSAGTGATGGLAPTASPAIGEVIRLPPTIIMQYDNPELGIRKPLVKPQSRANLWSIDEHERFLEGLELYPQGPWKKIAAIVGTKTTRQTMTHAQKYRQKIERRMRETPVKRRRRQLPSSTTPVKSTPTVSHKTPTFVVTPSSPVSPTMSPNASNSSPVDSVVNQNEQLMEYEPVPFIQSPLEVSTAMELNSCMDDLWWDLLDDILDPAMSFAPSVAPVINDYTIHL